MILAVQKAIVAMGAAMVAENSGIKDKKKLLQYLYTNPEKLAEKLSKFIKNSKGGAMPLVALKGTGQGYYYSMQRKSLVRVCRGDEFYLLPWTDTEEKNRCYVYTHHNWMTGCILRVFKSDIEYIGFN